MGTSKSSLVEIGSRCQMQINFAAKQLVSVRIFYLPFRDLIFWQTTRLNLEHEPSINRTSDSQREFEDHHAESIQTLGEKREGVADEWCN